MSHLFGTTRRVLGLRGDTVPLLIVLLALVASCATAPTRPSSADLEEGARVRSEAEAQLVEYPWGWIRWLMSSEIEADAPMTFGLVQVDANQDNPLHLHSNCEEYLYVLSGSCEHLVGDEWVSIQAGDLVRIPAGVSHRARTRDEPMRAVIAYSAGVRDFTAVEEGAESSE